MLQARVPPSAIAMMRLEQHRVLYNTASGMALALKVGQFVLQVYACIFLSLSMLAVWYFCPERIYEPPPAPPEMIEPPPPVETQQAPSSPSSPQSQDMSPARPVNNSPPLPTSDRLPGRVRTNTTSSMYSQQVPTTTMNYSNEPQGTYSYVGAIPTREAPMTQEGYVNVQPTNVM